jgi:hypothetical protein
VINSWTGTNFDEIWVQGTVMPKTWANATGGYQITDTGDPKDKAFVIPPGLKIYGGFKGTETASGTISADTANDKRDKTLSSTEDWRLRSVLSGALTGTTNTYHVVLMADVPDDQQTVLDGLTSSGGGGADGADRIDFRNYIGTNGIDKQSGAGLYLVNASPVLRNVRIQGNAATANSLDTSGTVGGGGGIYNLARDGGTSSPWLTNTVISNNQVKGNGSGAGMYNEARDANSVCSPVLSGVTIEGNQSTGNAGGIYNEARTSDAICRPEIKDDSLISKNIAVYGAGVYNFGYSAPIFSNMVIQGNIAGSSGGGMLTQTNTRPVFTNVTISGNFAGNGGGVDNRSQWLTMTNVTISGNTASNGGGLYNFRGSGGVLTNVRIENNSCTNGGGGILNNQSSANTRNVLVITNGVIQGNTASSGGGIHNEYGFTGNGDTNQMLRVVLTNVLIVDNTANNGGGIYNSITGNPSPGKGISILLNNVTIANNTANAGNGSTNGGGGIYTPAETKNDNGTIVTNPVQVIANNSIIWGNDAPNQSSDGRDNIFNTTASRLTLNYSLAQNGYTYTTGDNNKNPGDFDNTLFTNFSAGDYTLSTGTTGLVNGGSNSLYPNTATGVDTLLGGALTGTGARETDFKALIQAAVFDSGAITKDATAAVGNASGTGNARIQGTAIDVGAYEQ